MHEAADDIIQKEDTPEPTEKVSGIDHVVNRLIGLVQIAQIQIRCRKMRHLIGVYTVWRRQMSNSSQNNSDGCSR